MPKPRLTATAKTTSEWRKHAQHPTAPRKVCELVERRRRQMLIHSALYYRLNTSTITDHEWQARAEELVALQRQHGAAFGFYDEAFADWDASTGYHLPQDEEVMRVAARLLTPNPKLPPKRRLNLKKR